MMRTTSSPREMTSRPLGRLVAAATLAAFLVAQSWVVCAPLCLLNGHAKFAVAASQYQDHVMHCHSDKVSPAELPAPELLGSMLPTHWAPALPSLHVVTVELGSPNRIHLQQVPSADPPPPRAV
jgi:hypothetical protein